MALRSISGLQAWILVAFHSLCAPYALSDRLSFNSSTPVREIRAAVGSASETSRLTVEFEHGVYYEDHLRAVLSSRSCKCNLTLTGDSWPNTSEEPHVSNWTVISCNESISLASLRDVAIERLSFSECLLKFDNCEFVSLRQVEVTATLGAPSDRSQRNGSFAAWTFANSRNVTISNSLFKDCSLLPLAILDSVAVSIQSTHFTGFSGSFNMSANDDTATGLLYTCTSSRMECVDESAGLFVSNCSFADNKLRVEVEGVGDTDDLRRRCAAAMTVLGDSAGASVVLEHVTFKRNTVRTPLPDWWNSRKPYSGGKQKFVDAKVTGGGLCVALNGSAKQDITIEDGIFKDNSAWIGSGMALWFAKRLQDKHVRIQNTKFLNNLAPLLDNMTALTAFGELGHLLQSFESAGAGLDIRIDSDTMNCKIDIKTCNFKNNFAATGGGLNTLNYGRAWKTTVILDNCTFVENQAANGAAATFQTAEAEMSLAPSSSDFVFGSSRYLSIANCTFLRNIAYVAGSLVLTSLRAAIVASVFKMNINIALDVLDSEVLLKDRVTFTENTAAYGAGMHVISSRLVGMPAAVVHMEGNTATATGGAIYVNPVVRSLPLLSIVYNPQCFLSPPSDQSISEWNFTMNITGNTAGQSGAGIYIVDALMCGWDEEKDELNIRKALKWSHIMHYSNNRLYSSLANHTPYVMLGGAGLDSYPAFNQVWSEQFVSAIMPLTNRSQTGGHADIATDIMTLKIRPTNRSRYGYDACSDIDDHVVTCNVAPGETFLLNVVGKDQYEQEVDVVSRVDVAHRLVSDKYTRPSPQYTFVVVPKGRPATVSLLGQRTKTSTIRLTVMGLARVISTSFRVRFTNCHDGFKIVGNDEDDCKCNTKDFRIVFCTDDNVYLKEGYWAADECILRDLGSNEACEGKNHSRHREIHQDSFAINVCPPNYCRCERPKDTDDFKTHADACLYNEEHPNLQCGNHRHGVLCGSCKEGYTSTLAVYNGQCIENCTEWTPESRAVVAGVYICGAAIAFLLLVLDFPLSNDIRGLVFYGAVVRLVFSPTDTILENNNFRSLRFLISIGELKAPGDAGGCNFPNLTALTSIQVGLMMPAIFVLAIIIMHSLSRLHRWAIGRWLARHSIWQATWLLSFYPFQHFLQSASETLHCISVFKNDNNAPYGRFFLNANQPCLKGDHLPWAILSIFLLLCIAVFLTLISLLLLQKLDKYTDNTLLTLATVLRTGLRERFEWWGVWDLLRRGLIVSLYIPSYTHPELKQLLIIVACVWILLFHCIVQPYVTPSNRDSTAFYTIPPLLRRRNACNLLEAAVLFDLIVVAVLAIDSGHDYISPAVSATFVTIPIVGLFLLAFYKVLVLLYHRYLETKGELHQVNRPPDSAADLTFDTMVDGGNSADRYSMSRGRADSNTLRRSFLSAVRSGAQLRGGLMRPLLLRSKHGDDGDSAAT